MPRPRPRPWEEYEDPYVDPVLTDPDPLPGDDGDVSNWQAAPPDPLDTGGGGGKKKGGGGLGGLMPSAGRPQFSFGPAPRFTPPPDFRGPAFRRPTLQDALNEPGYQFRLQGGTDALERSAAARGVLRTGGTLRDLTEYGQNFASQEYGNVFNRALAGYDRDYRGAYDAYQSQYQGARDQFAPRLAEWQMLSQAELQAALAQYQREWLMFALQHQNQGGGGAPPYIPPPPQGPGPYETPYN